MLKFYKLIENVLQRPITDIEIGWIRYERTQDYPDLLVEPSRIHERFSSYPPSYSTGNPPSYNYLDRYFINSNFENDINFILYFNSIYFGGSVFLFSKILYI